MSSRPFNLAAESSPIDVYSPAAATATAAAAAAATAE